MACWPWGAGRGRLLSAVRRCWRKGGASDHDQGISRLRGPLTGARLRWLLANRNHLMTVRIRSIAFDCTDPSLLAGFGPQVPGSRGAPGTRTPPEAPGARLPPPGEPPTLLFMGAP